MMSYNLNYRTWPPTREGRAPTRPPGADQHARSTPTGAAPRAAIRPFRKWLSSTRGGFGSSYWSSPRFFSNFPILVWGTGNRVALMWPGCTLWLRLHGAGAAGRNRGRLVPPGEMGHRGE
jgi:hypothetical protein